MKESDVGRVDRLGPGDLPEVVRLERLCFAYHWTEEQFKLGLERGAFRILGVRVPGGLAAYLAFSLLGGDMEILNLAVDPALRRQGLATKLLRALEDVCREREVSRGFLDVKVSNRAAIDLYGKFGFKQCGVRKNYYPDTGEDALLFSKEYDTDQGLGPAPEAGGQTPEVPRPPRR